MSRRRKIHVDLELPELTPAQADFLWNFLDELQAEIWDVYEADLLAFQDESARPSQNVEDELTDDDWADLATQGPAPPVNDDDSDPNDF